MTEVHVHVNEKQDVSIGQWGDIGYVNVFASKLMDHATGSIYKSAKYNTSEMTVKNNNTVNQINYAFTTNNCCFNTNQQLLLRASKVILQIATKQLQALPFIKILQCKDNESHKKIDMHCLCIRKALKKSAHIQAQQCKQCKQCLNGPFTNSVHNKFPL